MNLISKDVYQFTHCFTLQTKDKDLIFDFFCVDSASVATSFNKSTDSTGGDGCIEAFK